MKKFYDNFLTVTTTRALINEGYKYRVDCDFTTCKTIDPWSGMPNINNNIAVFTDKAEAEAFAAEQVWPFNPDVHGTVEELRWGETYEEREARVEREKAERKAKREAKEAEKAAATGMTVDEYKAAKAKAAKRRALEREIAELEQELAHKRAKLAKLAD